MLDLRENDETDIEAVRSILTDGLIILHVMRKSF